MYDDVFCFFFYYYFYKFMSFRRRNKIRIETDDVPFEKAFQFIQLLGGRATHLVCITNR